MTLKATARIAALLVTIAALAACGRFGGGFDGGEPGSARDVNERILREDKGRTGMTLWDTLRARDRGDKVAVNRYLWNASLETLSFLPVQTVDPFTGVIVTGYGTPPGGGQAYRATVLIKDPALDARSINVALQTRGGRPVSAGTQRAIEDAILTRARQMRVADRKF